MGECYVVLWYVEGGKLEIFVFILLFVEYLVVIIDIFGFDEDGDVLRVIVVSEGGCVYIWFVLIVNEFEIIKFIIISVG